MSIYYFASAIVIGRKPDVQQIDRMITDAQSQSPSAKFERAVVLESDVCAIAYSAGNTNYRSQLQEVLSQQDLEIDALDVCVYLYRDAEMENVATLCYQHGKDLAESDDPYDNSVIDTFKARCVAYGVDLRREVRLNEKIDRQMAVIPPECLPPTLGVLMEQGLV
jgi:hypothetical protein